jgi:EpsI family protein
MRVPPSMKFNRQVLFSILTLVCLTILIHLPVSGKQIPLRKSFEGFPIVIGQWKCQGDNENNEEIPRLVGAQSHLARKYRDRAGHEIRLYTGYIERQAEAREVTVRILDYLGEPFESWIIVDQRVDFLQIPGYPKNGINVNRCIIQSSSKKQLMLCWYQIGGGFIANGYWAKISLVFNAILKNRRDGAFIYLSTPVTQTEDVSQKNIADFGKLAIPILAEYLPN